MFQKQNNIMKILFAEKFRVLDICSRKCSEQKEKYPTFNFWNVQNSKHFKKQKSRNYVWIFLSR